MAPHTPRSRSQRPPLPSKLPSKLLLPFPPAADVPSLDLCSARQAPRAAAPNGGDSNKLYNSNVRFGLFAGLDSEPDTVKPGGVVGHTENVSSPCGRGYGHRHLEQRVLIVSEYE